MRTLLEAGADKEAKNSQGNTALMIAAQKGKIEALKTLIGAGAEIAADYFDAVAEKRLAPTERSRIIEESIPPLLLVIEAADGR